MACTRYLEEKKKESTNMMIFMLSTQITTQKVV